MDRGGNVPASYEVEYRDGSSLIIPVKATEPCELNLNQTKLSIEALLDLVSVAESIDDDEYRSKISLVSAVADAAASDRRRRQHGHPVARADGQMNRPRSSRLA
jgi:hypothetical protein